MKVIRKRFVIFLLAFLMVFPWIKPLNASAAKSDSKAGVVTVSAGHLNVRKSASTTSSVVSTLKKNSYITLISQSGSWWYVEYAKGLYGYCHSSYIKEIDSSTATVNTQSSPLNVRSGAGTGYGKLGVIPKGETVIVLSTNGEWCRILYNGTKTGYVSKKYLAFANAYKAVSLTVPYYLQTDSRWSWVTLGSSVQTIGKIGCTTTAVAMVESYRQGKTIYPDAMSKKLSYTSSGSLYWPENYVGVTSGLNLQAIYDYLLAGKPVIIGFTTKSGGQHWAVVYGYSGGNSLKAGGFLIKDPGAQSRTTLADLMEDYPYFAKYVYYR